MKKNSYKFFVLVFALAFALASNVVWGATQKTKSELPNSDSCAQLLSNDRGYIYASPQGAGHKLPLMFGLESEFTIDRYSERLLEIYYPDKFLGVSAVQWRKMSGAEKVSWVSENLGRIFEKKKKFGKLVKQSKDPKYRFLPKQLIVDYTGNLEIVVDPVDTIGDWLENIKVVDENIGPGSMQATVGVPKKDLFAGKAEKVFDETLGMLQIVADLDALEKLELGYEKYIKNPNFGAAKPFQHPFLGPLTAKKRSLLENYLRRNSQGQGFDDEDLSHRISMMDDSFKFIGTTTYRPDLGGEDYVVFEIRDAHSDFELLKRRIFRAINIFSQPRDRFTVGSKWRAFDSETDFNKFPVYAQQCLKTLFPSKFIDSTEEYNGDEMLANEVFRNFAFPMRDWSAHLRDVGPSYSQQVTLARTRYIEVVLSQCSSLQEGSQTREQGSLQIQGALARFAFESGLREKIQNTFFQAHEVVSLPKASGI